MFPSITSSNSSSSSTTWVSWLAQASPLQSPHACIHFKPFLRQRHFIVPHGFLAVILHLHLITFSRWSGAGGKSVITGNSREESPSSLLHPHLHGLTSHSSSKLVPFIISRCTRNEWKCAARSVGGSMAGLTWEEVTAISFHLEQRSFVSESPFLPLYNNTISFLSQLPISSGVAVFFSSG